ncbi:hypothetical protein J4573_09210 [Actinomadura barringtoniae]|uniref:Uncharacterized protein n=1 Tax=Actinomadura barringtoniae TaxID=1427535 RepID=A0A939T1C3_9ACTN|nr:hypothetical protein [Actinomadura barringtoniae]MBO2447261.1 hypothetical protein [Actinomadura barringtoniae]
MAHWRDQLATAPPWQWGIGVAAVTVLAFGLGAPLVLHRPAHQEAWLIAPIAGALVGLVTAVAINRVRYADEAATGMLTRAERIELKRATRTGRAPADPNLAYQAMALIEGRRQQIRVATRWGPWIYGAFALLSILQARANPWWYALTVFWALWLAYALVGGRYQRSRLDRIERAVTIQLEDLRQSRPPQAPQ